MRRRKSRKATQPFDGLELILAGMSLPYGWGNYFAREIIPDRWRKFGVVVMERECESHREQVEQYGVTMRSRCAGAGFAGATRMGGLPRPVRVGPRCSRRSAGSRRGC